LTKCIYDLFILSLEVQSLDKGRAILITKEMLDAILQGKVKINANKKLKLGRYKITKRYFKKV